jgi:glycosyltransferase involved in cell wall biosynthesis
MHVSLVIPVFNAAAYLSRCLASITAQTHAELECVLIDDGSTDGSLKMAEEFIAAYSGPVAFRLLRHDCNRGQSAARNTGIRATTGDYLYFVDSDDEIWPDAVAQFVACVGAGDVDFAVGEIDFAGGGVSRWPIRMAAGLHQGREAILGSYLRSDWHTLAGNRFVRRRFLVEHDLFFTEGLVHEDDLWTLMLACRAQTMGVVKGPTYLCRIRAGSTMTSNHARRFDNWLQILCKMEDYVSAEGLGARPDVLKFFAVRRAELVGRARQAGLDARAVYQRDVRAGRPFDWRTFRSMGIGWKIRYLHSLFPLVIGYTYLNQAMRGVSRLAKIRKRLGTPWRVMAENRARRMAKTVCLFLSETT